MNREKIRALEKELEHKDVGAFIREKMAEKHSRGAGEGVQGSLKKLIHRSYRKIGMGRVSQDDRLRAMLKQFAKVDTFIEMKDLVKHINVLNRESKLEELIDLLEGSSKRGGLNIHEAVRLQRASQGFKAPDLRSASLYEMQVKSNNSESESLDQYVEHVRFNLEDDGIDEEGQREEDVPEYSDKLTRFKSEYSRISKESSDLIRYYKEFKQQATLLNVRMSNILDSFVRQGRPARRPLPRPNPPSKTDLNKQGLPGQQVRSQAQRRMAATIRHIEAE
jgi:hypothetical protein